MKEEIEVLETLRQDLLDTAELVEHAASDKCSYTAYTALKIEVDRLRKLAEIVVCLQE